MRDDMNEAIKAAEKDPVCGMAVDPDRAAARSAHDGKTLIPPKNLAPQIISPQIAYLMADMMSDVDAAPFWSILDQQGSQNMMRSALGDAAKIADYETVKKRVLGSYYTMDFSSGVNFDLTVVTSDSITAGTLSMMMKAVIMYKKSSATPVEKAAMDMATADSDGSKFMVHFKDSDAQFQSLMHSPLFAAISH